jgi:hypothetical protein
LAVSAPSLGDLPSPLTLYPHLFYSLSLSLFSQSFLIAFIFLSISFFSSKMVSFSFNILVCISAAFYTLVQATPTPGRHGAKVSGIGVPVSNEKAKNIISNRYIVVYNNNASDSAVETHQASVMTALRKRNLIARGKEGRMLSSKMDAFSMSGWRGMSLEAEDSMILEIASATEVAYVEADTVVKTGALVSQASAPAGLRRISHAAAGGAGYVYDNSSGGGIVAYVVDTGIKLTHAVSPLSVVVKGEWLTSTGIWRPCNLGCELRQYHCTPPPLAVPCLKLTEPEHRRKWPRLPRRRDNRRGNIRRR